MQANLSATDAVSCVLLLLRRLLAALVALFQPQEAPATERTTLTRCYARKQRTGTRTNAMTAVQLKSNSRVQQQPTGGGASYGGSEAELCTHFAHPPILLLPLVVSVPLPVPVVPVSWYRGRCCSGCQDQRNRVWISAGNAHDNSRRDTQNAAMALRS